MNLKIVAESIGQMFLNMIILYSWLIPFLFLLFVSIFLSIFIMKKIRLKKKLNELLIAKPVINPGATNLLLKGVAGDKVNVFVAWPELETKVENLERSEKFSSIEIKHITPDDLGRLAFFAKISANILNFNLTIKNKGGAVKFNFENQTYRLSTGEKLFIKSIKFNELSSKIDSLENWSLVTSSMMGHQFFDTEGQLKSQLDGYILIEPNLLSKCCTYILIFVLISSSMLFIKEVFHMCASLGNWFNNLLVLQKN